MIGAHDDSPRILMSTGSLTTKTIRPMWPMWPTGNFDSTGHPRHFPAAGCGSLRSPQAPADHAPGADLAVRQRAPHHGARAGGAGPGRKRGPGRPLQAQRSCTLGESLVSFWVLRRLAGTLRYVYLFVLVACMYDYARRHTCVCIL